MECMGRKQSFYSLSGGEAKTNFQSNTHILKNKPLERNGTLLEHDIRKKFMDKGTNLLNKNSVLQKHDITRTFIIKKIYK